MSRKVANPNRTRHANKPLPSIDKDGKKIRLDALPLVAYGTACGHIARDYGIQKKDMVWCQDCSAMKRVTRIIAQ